MKSYREQTYYELLEIAPASTPAEIREAYERALKVYDADNVALYPVGDPAQVEDLKALLLEAVEILTDADLRDEYDRSLGLEPSPHPEKKGPSPQEIDDRAESAREEADDRHAHEVAPSSPAGPAPDEESPTQLVMEDVVEKAETVHSTAPRYSVSYIPHLPAPAPDRGQEDAAAEPDPAAPPPPPRRATPPPQELERAQVIAQEEAIATAESALAGVSAQVQRAREAKAPAPAPPPPTRQKVEVGPDTEYGGELLRQVRESKGLTLPQLADRTRISSRHLENVEADRYEALPAPVYLRGMLMSMARELGLDPLRAARSYMALAEKALGKPK